MDTALKSGGTSISGKTGSLLRLVASTAKIGLIGFGGGNALVPVIEREAVQADKLITKEEFDKEVVVANITPGALPVEVASGVGRQVAGTKGMIAGALGMGLPGALLTFILLALYWTASEEIVTQVYFASVGVEMLIVYILCGYTYGAVSGKETTRARTVAILLVAAVFLLTCGKRVAKLFGMSSLPLLTVSTLDILAVVFFSIFFTKGKFFRAAQSPAKALIAGAISLLYLLGAGGIAPFNSDTFLHAVQLVMVVLGAWGFFSSLAAEHDKTSKFPLKDLARDAGAWLAFVAVLVVPALVVCPDALAFAGRAILSVFMSFGGGDAYLAFGQGVFVDTGMIDSDSYFDGIVTISNAMPGSIICKVLTGVGFVIGLDYGRTAACLTALAGFGVGVGVSGFTFIVMYYLYEEFEPMSIFGAIKRYIRPVIGGLLLTIAVQMFTLNLNVASVTDLSNAYILGMSIAILALVTWLGSVRKAPLGALILVAAVAGLVICNVMYFV